MHMPKMDRQTIPLNKLGGILIFMSIRIILGIVAGISSLTSISSNNYMYVNPSGLAIYYISVLILMSILLILLFSKKRAFVLLYITTLLFSISALIIFGNYIYAVIDGIIEFLFFLYLLRSKRVAVIYGTRQIHIEKIAAEPVNASSSQSRAAAGLQQLKQINPIAYKRNIVAQAAGYRDFAGMISANPSLDKSLAFATSDDELNRVALFFGYTSFEDMYLASEEKWQTNHTDTP